MGQVWDAGAWYAPALSRGALVCVVRPRAEVVRKAIGSRAF
jgi:hypothetical protein